MNTIIITGVLQKDIEVRNGVAFSRIRSDNTYFNLVAFGKVINEIKDHKAGEFLIINGEMQSKKYQDKLTWQVVVHSIIDPINKDTEQAQVKEEISEETEYHNAKVEIDEDDLPF